MSVNDFIKQGVTVQGYVNVKSYGADGSMNIHFEGYAEDEWYGICIDEEWAERDITYIWCDDGVLHIEVEGE